MQKTACSNDYVKKKKYERNIRYALFLAHLLYTPKSSKYIQGHIDHEVSLYSDPLGGKGIFDIWSIMVNAKQSGFSNSLVFCWFPSVFTGCFAIVVVFCRCCFFPLCIFSLFLFFREFNYSYCSWAVELKNHLLSCIFTLYSIHSQLFISAMLFRPGSEIAYLYRAKKAVSFTQGL